MRKFFSSLSFKIGSVLILTEIVILAVVGAIYANRFSDQIDKRIEDRVRLPGILVNNSLVRVIAIRDADSLRLLVGEEIEDAILIDAEHLTSTFSLSGQFDGQHIDEIPGLVRRHSRLNQKIRDSGVLPPGHSCRRYPPTGSHRRDKAARCHQQ